jgi:L-aspartate oxidase
METRFPTILGKCLEIGIDPRHKPIPVVPAAHYFCGGILVDLNGRTTLEGLYAAGECACTGVHGANRLASTSLLEGLLWGWAVGRDISKENRRKFKLSQRLLSTIPDWISPGQDKNEDPALIAQDWATIRNTMWNYVGISRTTPRLKRAFEDLRILNKRLHDFYRETPISRPLVDLFHGCQTAYLVTQAALRNSTSLGCHHRKG